MNRVLSSTRAIRSVCLVTAAALVFVAPTTFAAEWSDDFSGGIDPEYWSFWAIEPEFVVDDTQGYVEFSNPYGGDGWGYFEDIGICFKGRLTGDFNVSVAFSHLLLEDPGHGANEANLSVFFGGQDISIERRNDYEEGQTIVSWVGPPDEWQGSQPSDASSGIMRIVRNGNDVTTSVNDQPVVISGTFNGAPVTGMCLRLANWGGLGMVSVRFDNFSVTADGIDFPLPAWRRHVATTTQNDGGDSALAFDPSGNEVAIAFTDWDSGELKVVRGAKDGPVWLWGAPEVVAPGGQDIDLSYDSCGDLWLSYLELSPFKDGPINLAHWSAADGTWSLRLLDSGSTVGRGVVTSLALPQGQCGPPSVAYRLTPKNRHEVTFAEAGEPPVVVEGGREYKGLISLAYAPNGEPAIAYAFEDLEGRPSIRLNTRSSGVWTPETVVDHGGDGINGVGLAYQNGLPVIAYAGRSSEPLFFCEQQGSWSCNSLNDTGMSRPSIVVNDDNDVVTVGAVKWDSMWVYSRPFQGTYWYAERFGQAAPGDAAVDPTGSAAFSFWLGPDLYLGFRHPGTCSSDHHCDDANPCSIDSCSDTGFCTYAFLADGAECGTSDEVCCSGQCVARYALDGSCDDGNECTTDQYVSGSNPPCSAYCQHGDIPGCGGGDCLEKGDPCTNGDECCSGLCHPVKGTCK